MTVKLYCYLFFFPYILPKYKVAMMANIYKVAMLY